LRPMVSPWLGLVLFPYSGLPWNKAFQIGATS